jgi:hypothetical protein
MLTKPERSSLSESSSCCNYTLNSHGFSQEIGLELTHVTSDRASPILETRALSRIVCDSIKISHTSPTWRDNRLRESPDVYAISLLLSLLSPNSWRPCRRVAMMPASCRWHIPTLLIVVLPAFGYGLFSFRSGFLPVGVRSGVLPSRMSN